MKMANFYLYLEIYDIIQTNSDKMTQFLKPSYNTKSLSQITDSNLYIVPSLYCTVHTTFISYTSEFDIDYTCTTRVKCLPEAATNSTGSTASFISFCNFKTSF